MGPRNHTNGRPTLFPLDWDAVTYAGLSSEASEIASLLSILPERITTFVYKNRIPCVWIVFFGGTGTGKSTLFNALCRRDVSETGVERPKTTGPILYAHADCPLDQTTPFPSMFVTKKRFSQDSGPVPASGDPGLLTMLSHDRPDWKHIILVDTPDLDSVEKANRRISERMFLLADVILFVASEEKYADAVPYEFLFRVIREEKPYHFILNKSQGRLTKGDVLSLFESKGLAVGKDRIWLIPYTPDDPANALLEEDLFLGFARRMDEACPAEKTAEFLEEDRLNRAGGIMADMERLLQRLHEERSAAEPWLRQLETLYETTSHEFIQTQQERFARHSHDYLKAEVRALFARYDVLARPRRLIQQIVFAPLRILGMERRINPRNREEAFARIRGKIDFASIEMIVQRFNRLALERLSPEDEASPLFQSLRRPEIQLDAKEMKHLVLSAQEDLEKWLNQTFESLSRGIPKSKKWGIYGTSIVWGILILALETSVGGGFTFLDAAMDAALAPFVTKGAMEIFSYREIKKITKELSERYRNGLLSVLQEQRDRYESCLKTLLPGPETIGNLEKLKQDIERIT